MISTIFAKKVENAFYQNENNNDTTTWNTPESFYKSIPYLIIWAWPK